MLTTSQSRLIAEQYIRTHTLGDEVIIEEVETTAGIVYWHETETFYRTRNPMDMKVGPSRFLVDNQNGSVYIITGSQSVDNFIEAHVSKRDKNILG